MAGEFWEIGWDGKRYTQRFAGRVPDRWSSQGFSWQGTELEGACFATKIPSLPTWSEPQPVPGEMLTNEAPGISTDASGNLHVIARNAKDSQIYINSMWSNTGFWTSWLKIPGSSQTIQQSPAMAVHNHVLYAFAVRTDGAVIWKPLFGQATGLSTAGWQKIRGSLKTNAGISVTTWNGRLNVCAKDLNDRNLYLNQLSPGGKSWSGWDLVSTKQSGKSAPSVTAFNDELLILVSDFKSGKILANVGSPDDNWTSWHELPGSQRITAKVITAIGYDQLYVFARKEDGQLIWNVASDTGTWSGWRPF